MLDLLDSFQSEASCIKQLMELRWKDGVVSPFDENSVVYMCENGKFKCKNTGKYFNAKTGTIFESTKISLRKWFLAIYLMCNHKKGISSAQLARDIHVTQKTAWYMLQKIRECFTDKSMQLLVGEVEMDETFVGGKNKNRHRDKKVKRCQGRSFKDKTPVFGMLERCGKMVAKVIPNTNRESIYPIVKQHVELGTKVFTDEWHAYNSLNYEYERKFVDHGKGQYVNEDIYTNNIEGSWSILKRMIIGIYHSTSKKHLQRYVNEFVYRYNTRKMSDGDRFINFFSSFEKRITHHQIVESYAA